MDLKFIIVSMTHNSIHSVTSRHYEQQQSCNFSIFSCFSSVLSLSEPARLYHWANSPLTFLQIFNHEKLSDVKTLPTDGIWMLLFFTWTNTNIFLLEHTGVMNPKQSFVLFKHKRLKLISLAMHKSMVFSDFYT